MNPHPRDKRIFFDEKPHIYYIDGKAYDTSVTKWIHSYFPHFNADLIIAKMMKSKKWPQSKYFGKTAEEIKKEWSDNGKKASAAGTKLHYDIECFYNNNPQHNESKEYQMFLNFHYQIGANLTPYRTEWTVFDEELKLSGSIDMIFEKSDKTLLIYDWKRSKAIRKTNMYECATAECINHLPNANFWHYSLQLNTYKMILERNYNKTVSGMFLVVLHPNQETWQRITVPNLHDEMQDLIALRLKELSPPEEEVTPTF